MSFDYNKNWKNPAVKIGRITLILATLASFIPAIYLAFFHGARPEFGIVAKSWFTVLSIYGLLYIVEPISYYSALGLSGTYLSFLSGNIGNMRVPCSIVGMEATNTEPGSKKAEIISTIAIVGSIIANLVLLTAMSFIGSKVIEIMPPYLVYAFQSFTIPAVCGAILFQAGMKQPKLVPFGIAIPAILFMINLPTYLITFFTVISMVIISKYFYKKNEKKIEILSQEGD